MKKIEYEGAGDNDGFFELEVKASPKERVVSWISVEDKLPKMTRSNIWSDDDCIVATEYNFEIGRTKNGEWVNMLNQSIVGVTHWMPIPEPPQSN